MIRNPTRRRFLAITAAALAAPAGASARTVWRGRAMGAEASMQLAGLADHDARRIFALTEAELDRLERIFSLFRRDSALVQLNRDGVLDAPPPELLDVLSLSAGLNDATGGAFDPTVQPLWRAHADAAQHGRRLAGAALERHRRRTGWYRVRFDAGQVRFTQPGMALTLNGIAQGYVTDRIARLLRQQGLTDMLIDMGEIAAVGRRPDGTAWRAGIARPDGQLQRRLTLRDRALATSAPMGTVLDPAGKVGHILDPKTGGPAGAHALVSVSAPSAALADGLSTACSLLTTEHIAHVLSRFPGARLETIA